MIYFILGAIIGLAVSAMAAKKFEEIANEKGFAGYFWWCFLLGMIGWAMVIALPDRGMSPTGQPVVTAPVAVTGASPAQDDSLPEL